MDTSNNNNIFIDQDALSLKDLLIKLRNWGKYLKSKLFVILIIGLIGGIIGIIKAFYEKPLYTAEMTFVLEGASQGGSPLGGYAGIASQFGLDMGAGGGQGVFEGENFLALMKSRLMTEKALLTDIEVDGKKITLADLYLNFSGLREKWIKKDSPLGKVKFQPGAIPGKFSRLENKAINIIHNSLLAENLNVDKRDKKSGIISVKVTSENELFSKWYVEKLTMEVSSFYVDTKTKKSADNLKILQHQTDSIKRRLNYSIIGAAASMDANPNANPARQILRVPAQRSQGEAQINQAILSHLIQNLEIAKMTLRTETPLVQIIDRPVLPISMSEANLITTFIKWVLLFSLLTIGFIVIRKVLSDI